MVDAVGSPSSPCREGAGLSPPSSDGDYAFVPKTAANQLVDTNDNVADFDFVSPTAGVFGGLQAKLGGMGAAPNGCPPPLLGLSPRAV